MAQHVGYILFSIYDVLTAEVSVWAGLFGCLHLFVRTSVELYTSSLYCIARLA
jgi:hypothetical protein